MSQSTVVMAFRKRLKSYGYTDISIKYDRKKDVFCVEANEPLGGNRVQRIMPEMTMYYLFRR